MNQVKAMDYPNDAYPVAAGVTTQAQFNAFLQALQEILDPAERLIGEKLLRQDVLRYKADPNDCMTYDRHRAGKISQVNYSFDTIHFTIYNPMTPEAMYCLPEEPEASLARARGIVAGMWE